MTRHILKCEQPWYQGVHTRHKTFEVRFNDRDYQPGDVLNLRECWIDEDGEAEYSGRECERLVTYMLREGEHPGLAPGYVVLGLWPDAIGPRAEGVRT